MNWKGSNGTASYVGKWRVAERQGKAVVERFVTLGIGRYRQSWVGSFGLGMVSIGSLGMAVQCLVSQDLVWIGLVWQSRQGTASLGSERFVMAVVERLATYSYVSLWCGTAVMDR